MSLLVVILSLALVACGTEEGATPVNGPVSATGALSAVLREPTAAISANGQADAAKSDAAPLTDTASLNDAVAQGPATTEADGVAVTDAVAAQPFAGLALTEDALVNLYEQTNPGVVNIVTDTGEGSGFVYDTAGHIVTNNHVVEGATRLSVRFADGAEAAGTVVGTDPDSDLAVVRVNLPADRLTPLPLGASSDLRVGQFVVAIGNPFGLQGSMTIGIVSGLGRLLDEGQGYSISDVIQTDAAINPGNSGGPLLNLRGEVVGVNTAIESPVRANSGIGYAVPAAMVQRAVPSIIQDGAVSHPYLGLSGGTLDAATIQALDLPEETRGVLVATVVAGGPSARAGLRGGTRQATINGIPTLLGGDVITAIDGQTIQDFDDLLTYIVQRADVGQTVTLTIIRDGAMQEIPVVLGERP